MPMRRNDDGMTVVRSVSGRYGPVGRWSWLLWRLSLASRWSPGVRATRRLGF